MSRKFSALILAAVIGLIIVSIGLGFLIGLDNPIPWLLLASLALIPFAYKKLEEKPFIVWKDEYSVGIKELDNDHKKLIYLLNQFKTAYDYDISEEFEHQALEDLVSYTHSHFEREETMMKESGYPDYENHKAQHARMIKQVDGFVEKYKAEGHEALDEVCDFLNNWLINHINGTDKSYSQYLKDKGIS